MLKRASRAGAVQARLFAGKSRSCCPSLSSLGFAGSWSAGAMPGQHPCFFFCWGAPHRPRSAAAPQQLHSTGQCSNTLPSPGHPGSPPGALRRQPPARLLSAVPLGSHGGSQPFPGTLLLTPGSLHSSLALPGLLLVRSVHVKGCTCAFSERALQMTNQPH